MGKVWITSDTHWCHTNICRGVSTWSGGYRDFDTVEEHNRTILNNINECVKEGDILIHLGDWVFGDKKVNLDDFVSKLNTNKIVTTEGNHDKPQVLKDKFGHENVHRIHESAT